MAWAAVLYVFTALVGGLFVYYYFTKSKKPKGAGDSPLKRCKVVRKTLPIGTKKGWELIGVEHGLRLWQRSEAEDDLKFGSSVILPVSLKVLVEMLTDPLLILEWDPWVTSVSRVTLSNKQDLTTQFSGDVISLTQTPNSLSKFLEIVEILLSLFKSDSKVCSRTWHHEESIRFWLHSAVVEPFSSDPVYTMFMAFPMKGKSDEMCEVTVISEGMSNFNPCSLTAKLAGLKDYIAHIQSDVLYPEAQDEEKNIIIDDDEEFEEIKVSPSNNPEENYEQVSEAFVDVTGVYLRPEKDVQKYKVAIDNAQKKILECYNAKAGDDGWSFVGNVKDIEILKKAASPGFSKWDCTKGTGEVNVPIHYLLAYCDDLNHKGEWDDMYCGGHVIEQLGDLTKINYMEFRAMWPVSGRDFCVFDAIRVLPDNTYVLVVKSVKHPACPPRKKLVRGKINIGGFVFKELSKDPPRIMVTYLTHADLAGSVPSSIVNKVTANQPQSVAILKQCVEKMYKEELDNPNSTSQFKANAMSYLEKIERAKNGMQSATSAETTQASDEKQPQSKPVASVNGNVVGRESEDGPSPNVIRSSSSAPNFHSPSIKASPFDNIGTDFKTIGNQATAGLLQEIFEVAEVDITKSIGSSEKVYEQWEYRGTEKDVMMFRKIHTEEKMHSFIGKGIISCSPSRVWETLKKPEARYHFDNMLKDTKVLAKVSETSHIQYMHFEAANCFQKQARDFVALRTERKEKDKYLLSFISVDYHNNVPVKKDVKRAKILASGWVVEPVLHNGQLYSMVTYLSQMNPGGNYPASLINFVARKQPLCIAYLRKYIVSPDYFPSNHST